MEKRTTMQIEHKTLQKLKRLRITKRDVQALMDFQRIMEPASGRNYKKIRW